MDLTSPPPLRAVDPRWLTVRPDPRLAADVLAATVAILGAVVLGRAELVVAGAPFAVLAARGVARRRPPVLAVGVEIDDHRRLDGEAVLGTLALQTDGAADHDVLLVPGDGFVAHPDAPGAAAGWRIETGHQPAAPAARTHTATVALLPTRIGRLAVGTVHIRSRRPGGLLQWDLAVPLTEEIQVVPAPSRLIRLLEPPDPQGAAGPHRSRARGHGSDVAELRPYQPGDRLRDMSWAATARTGAPWVTEHHPERTGAVVLFVDGAGDGTGRTSPAFGRLLATTWALAAAHLAAGDRVGALGHGPAVVWLPPAGGRRARLALLDAMLTLASPERRRATNSARPLVVAEAVVIGVTMLQSESFIAALARYRRHGRSTVAIVVDPTSGVADTDDPVEHAARRLWLAELEVRRETLGRAGVPSAIVRGPAELRAALTALRRRAARPTLRRAR